MRLAEASLAQAQADVAFSEAQLANTQIRAPFSGVVVKKMAEVGESVAPIPPGVNISTASGRHRGPGRPRHPRGRGRRRASRTWPSSATNQPAEVTVEAFPDRRYKAVLRQVIPTADRTKATVQVKVTILDKDKDLKPEMSAKVTFLEPEKRRRRRPTRRPCRVVTVPKDAVATRDGKSVVFEVVQGKAKARPVTRSASARARWWCARVSPVARRWCGSRPRRLKDGDSVRIKP